LSKSVAVWIDPITPRVGSVQGPFIQELEWAELAEAGVCLKLIGEREMSREVLRTKSWVTANSGRVHVGHSFTGVWVASFWVIRLLGSMSIEPYITWGIEKGY
jgi:hypothetical protein